MLDFRKKEDAAKERLNSIYETASKNKGDLYATLKSCLDEELKEDSSDSKWHTYKMVCENYNFSAFNLSVVSVVAAIMAIVLDEMPCVVIGIALLYSLFVIVWAIRIYEKERRYKYIGYVLDTIKSEKEDNPPFAGF